jgi:hypothetical protein
MSDEWLTYSEIGARLGLNPEAARTRVRRAGWRTQPGNDGRTRVLVPDRALQNPVDRPGQDRPNGTRDLTGLVDLLTAAEARISRLERQVEAERVRVDESRSEADGLRAELTIVQACLTAQTDRADEVGLRAEAAENQAQELRQAFEDLQATDSARRSARLPTRLLAALRRR